MTKCLYLDYSHSYILEGFRKNNSFIDRHKNTLDMISDKLWRNNKYINNEQNISSPTRTILGRYVCNILSALLIDISEKKINEIRVLYESIDKIDSYSKFIFTVTQQITKIDVSYIFNDKKEDIKEITPENMRVQIKRGLYDHFSNQDSNLLWIYNYFKTVYNGGFYKLDSLIDKYNYVEDKYEKWLLIKAIINQGIRQNEKKKVEIFLELLKENNKGKYDYVNSYSYYLLHFYSVDKSILFLEDNLCISEFLESSILDFSQSLVFKNYASLLPNNNMKKEIMKKCLEQTPQDTDLWKEWLKLYANPDEVKKISTDIFKCGYSDPTLIKQVKIDSGDTDVLVRMIILCSTNLNKDIALYLASFLNNKLLKDYMLLFIEMFDFSDILKGEINEICL